uniref:G-patch domain-containing protein n=1 Tax=Ananas comosus var. bracteatus TaxID=296719 RepID=A0A6V7PKC9_ANACO|nr:unnamed protein product [Ananas comosus var. bracteatus]
MDKGIDSSLFVNDGSFMEKFKQLQESNREPMRRRVAITRIGWEARFQLEAEVKVAVAPVKFNADEEEEEGREREIGFWRGGHEEAEVGFLFDKIVPTIRTMSTGFLKRKSSLSIQGISESTSHIGCVQQPILALQHLKHQVPLIEAAFNKLLITNSCFGFIWTYEESSYSGELPIFCVAGDSSGSSASDPIAMMEFYMKKAAQEERRRQPRQSKDEMPPPPCLQGPPKKGHHMATSSAEELEKFMSNCNDAAAQKAAKEAAERARIQADNIGHKLLSKMGWKEGEGLGSDKSGGPTPAAAGEVTAEDDIYEQYKKRMMLGYRYRPNPLNNPRKAYLLMKRDLDRDIISKRRKL